MRQKKLPTGESSFEYEIATNKCTGGSAIQIDDMSEIKPVRHA